MVKILQAYNFAKQNTFSLSGEILSATLIGSNRVAVSSPEQFIEIYDVEGKLRLSGEDVAEDDSGPTKYSLATVGEVVNLIYCEAGKYLLTLEKENVGSPVHTNSSSISCTSSNTTAAYSEDDTKMFVRVYANFWKFPEVKLVDMPITIRIASMTTPKAALIESIDVIELPLRSPPDLIQCCQTSGNIIVSSRERIYLYEYTHCTHENTQPRFSYIDFLPFKFFVNLSFVPLKINLAENVIACMSNRFCLAFKIVDIVTTNSAVYPLDNDYSANIDCYGDEIISSSESSAVSKASAGPSSHNSFDIDSLETSSTGQNLGATGFPGRTPIDFNVARMVNSACGRDFEIELRSQWDQNESLGGTSTNAGGGVSGCDSQEIVITPSRANDIKIELVNEAKAMNVQRISHHGNLNSSPRTEDSNVQYEVRRLLQICMKTSEPSGRIIDILRCMDLKAIYQRKLNNAKDGQNAASPYEMENQQVPTAVTSSKHINRRTLKSGRHQNCIGYALLVASSIDGYLYQFCAQGKWYNENEKPIATYSFTAPVLKVHINPYVIYAITTESVETHTSRIGHKLFNNRFEYPTVGGLFPEESSPDVNSAITVIGLCSFMNVQYVCVNHENLILISNSSACETSDNTKKRSLGARLLRTANSLSQPQSNEWTLYNLELPKEECVIDDLEGIAESYRCASSSNFFDIMEEAHVMLRLSLTLQIDNLSAEREKNLHIKFMENCRKLADFSIRSTKKEVFLQATGFYKMCNLQLAEIYTNYITNLVLNEKPKQTSKTNNRTNDIQLNAEQLVGIIYTVKMFLLSLGTDRLKSTFLHQSVKPFFTPNRVIKQGFPQVPLALEFLNLFIKYAPADIPQIMLSSPVVADSISGELINYLKYLDQLNAEEHLLYAVTSCRMSNYPLSQELIAASNRHDLGAALIKHKNILFDDGTVLFQKQRLDSKTARNQSALHRKQSLTRRYHKRIQSHGQPEHRTPQPQAIVSFSEFTETILLATDNTELIEAISDCFVHALCVERSITLDMVLQLFLNYIASHIGHKGYQTSQKVFVHILQVYYYDLFDLNPLNNSNGIRSNTLPPVDDDYDDTSLKAPSLNSDHDNESIANSISESHSAASSSAEERYATNAQNRIIYDQLQEPKFHVNIIDHDAQQQLNLIDEETNLKGLKILFRMYLGRLKELSDLITDLQSADIEQEATNEDLLNLRMECIKFMMRHLHEMRQQHQQEPQLSGTQYYYAKSTLTANSKNGSEKKLVLVPLLPDYKLVGEEFENHIKTYIRPIPYLLDRPQYLNRLPPFKRSDFHFASQDEGFAEVHFQGWHNELLTVTLKIQALLASPKIEREIIEEFIAFIQKTPNLIGIDSFLVIILPKNLAINYMLNFCPDYMWQYGKSNGFTPKHWESLLRKILSKQEILPNWKSHITEILNNLVAELTFEELLQCFPNEVIPNRNAGYETMNSNIKDPDNDSMWWSRKSTDNASRRHFPMDNIDESNIFELTLRKAVSKQRSIALRSMIESTGTQLFDATSNPMYNL